MKKNEAKLEALLWSYELVTSDNPVLIENQTYEDLHRELSKYLNNLLVSDYYKLIAVLYRIDVAEEKAIVALAENAQKESAGETLARLIIERQLEKVITRRKYRNG